MPIIYKTYLFAAAILFHSCGQNNTLQENYIPKDNEPSVKPVIVDAQQPKVTINTGTTKPAELIAYAKTLIGVPYKYGSLKPDEGFDCSGFITYVFNHFNIAVPRSSVDFTYVKQEIPINQAKPGDLILFTGTDSTKRVVGHMGILTQTGAEPVFIHSTSGKANGVTETPLNSYYQGRYVKTLRIFKGDY
ncbi:C40 family peptidase [Mucilaginibacter aquatilis]|uniref:NlpC/P60 family protein n=1 Tax=Mucilaginibacter aquatilis TaxID=1517760 RepID=A0A6I4I542_9SPHI|nr:C40 family peptidase [Mucilaginibacter aquatilis]MVN90305.1 NlpC/P60 family protein [Mucilaginibacter aquatilis]